MKPFALKKALALFFIWLPLSVIAQVGINTTDPESTAILDLKSNNKGLLMPRLTSTEISSIADPAAGLIVYCTDLKIFCYYDGTDWISLPAWGQKINFGDTGAKQDVSARVNENSNVAIGTFPDPAQSRLTVAGNVAVGDNIAAPAEGAYIKGQVKIGNAPDAGDVATLEVDGDINSQGKIKENGNDLLPRGAIIMWSGDVIPDGWALCDGNNGTPDLSGRFILGAGSRKQLTLNADGSTTEALATTPHSIRSSGGYDFVQLSVEQMPSHNHPGSIDQSGNHNHRLLYDTETGGGAMTYLQKDCSGYDGGGCESNDSSRNGVESDGNHTHTLHINNSGSGQSHANLPPYYVLAFIMKL